MAKLLMLPREIRDAIIDLAITTPIALERRHDSDAAKSRIPPLAAAADDITKNSYRPGTIGYSLYDTAHDNVLYASGEAAYRPNAIGLLLVNRQLYQETKEGLRRFPVESTLNVEIVREVQLWPTFTSIPVRTCCLNTLDIILSLGLPSSNGESRFGGSTPLWTSVVEIILRFLKSGPTCPSYERPYDNEIWVKNLRFNCTVPSPLPGGFELAPEGLPIYREMWSQYARAGDQYWALQGRLKPVIEPGKRYVMRPEILAGYIHTSLRSLLFDVSEFSSLLYQRVGELHVYVNGKQYKDANLEECLNLEAQAQRDSELRGRRYAWLKENIRLRRERGLPIPEICAEIGL